MGSRVATEVSSGIVDGGSHSMNLDVEINDVEIASSQPLETAGSLVRNEL